MITQAKSQSGTKVPMNVFPALESVEAAIQYAEQRFPGASRNDIVAVLAVWTNTVHQLRIVKEK